MLQSTPILLKCPILFTKISFLLSFLRNIFEMLSLKIQKSEGKKTNRDIAHTRKKHTL